MAEQKRNIFVAKLARSAATTVMVGTGVIPPNHTTITTNPPLLAQEFVVPSQTMYSGSESQAASNQGSFFVRFSQQAPSIWDKKLEREFRGLALQEAKGTISAQNAYRLEQLSRWRDQLLCPQTPEETLLQIKRDRLLARMEDLLKEYVEFQETANQARSAS